MASASISFVLNRLGELAVKEAALLRGVGDDIRLLRDKLEWLQTFIQHADQERRTGDNEYVRLWVRQTRDVAYEVEDVLDEFLLRVDLDKLGFPAWKKCLKLATSCTTQVSFRHDLKDRMDNIKNRLKEISDNVDKYNIKKQRSDASTSAPNSSISTVAAWDEETEVLGSEKELKDLEKLLLSDDTSRSVISIVGESGVGKSTVAWKVYDSPNIREQFDVRAWINVPPQIRDNDILHFIYHRLCPGTGDDQSSTTQGVHDALSQHLMEKRYLVMVDGLVNFTDWNSMLHSLPNNAKGSRVMIITRLDDKEAAYGDPKVRPVKITNLAQEDSRKLFRRMLFLGGTEHDEERMEKACTDMFEITQGLPLAIVVLAGLLRTKSTGEWDSVFEQLKLRKEAKRVKGILTLSFDDLPSRLKSCFLYFSGMPENMIFNARRLVRLWAAEGFLKAKKGKTMEDIGQSYLRELISRGLIHLVKKDLNGGVWLVAIHDRLHAFAQSEAQEASFLEVHDNTNLLASASMRRLYLQNYRRSYVPIDISFPKLRTILCDFAEERFSNSEQPQQPRTLGSSSSSKNQTDLRYHALHFLSTSKFLRVIDLRGLRISKVPRAIGDMVHVRYLGLRSRSLAELPSSIARLINLQTLDIKRTGVEKVTQAFWEIPTLRHVVANKLRLPMSVGVLNNMQTLTGLVCSDPWRTDFSPLHQMVYLRYLKISDLTDQHWKGLADAFTKLESLLYLHLAGKGAIPFEYLFTKFTLPSLQILELYGKIDMSNARTEERYTLPNLTSLVLKQSMVNQTFMNKIGELPSLKELVLSDESYDGTQLLFSDEGFNNITSLVMSNLKELLDWTIKPGSIPSIKRIALSGCSEMKIKLQGEDGEQDLKGLMKHLTEVVVCNMPENFVEPADSDFSDKINHVTIKTKSEDITDAMQRAGRWREGMVASSV